MRGKEDHARERQLRKDQTEAEALLWSRLRNRRLENFRFRRQHRIGFYFADFACSERRLIIELDGGQHVDRADYDEARTRFLEGQGYCVLRFWKQRPVPAHG
jgi:very-short-patch-repair endonuclease